MTELKCFIVPFSDLRHRQNGQGIKETESDESCDSRETSDVIDVMRLWTKCSVDDIVHSWFSICSRSIDKCTGKMTDGMKGSENDGET